MILYAHSLCKSRLNISAIHYNSQTKVFMKEIQPEVPQSPDARLS